MLFKKFEDGMPTGYLITEENLRHVLKDSDFDSITSPKSFEELGYAVVIPTTKPPYSPYQIVTEFETENEDGTWQQNWQVTELADEEKKKIFDDQLKLIVDEKNKILAIYNEQLKDPSE